MTKISRCNPTVQSLSDDQNEWEDRLRSENMDNRQLELNSLKQSERVHVLLFVEGVTSAMFE